MSFDPLQHETPTADLEALLDLARRVAWKARVAHGRPSVAVEVGTWAGRTALVLSEAFDVTFCVDHFMGNPGDRLGPLAKEYGQTHVFRTFAKNMGGRLCTSVFPCVGPSRTWASVWTRPVDFVFIDASHGYESCYADIEDWRRHVREGGVIACHDYGEFEGVTRAVDELMPGRVLAGATLAYEEVK